MSNGEYAYHIIIHLSLVDFPPFQPVTLIIQAPKLFTTDDISKRISLTTAP